MQFLKISPDFLLTKLFAYVKISYVANADVAELAYALDSGSSESNFLWVQVPSSAPSLLKLKLERAFFF